MLWTAGHGWPIKDSWGGLEALTDRTWARRRDETRNCWYLGLALSNPTLSKPDKAKIAPRSLQGTSFISGHAILGPLIEKVIHSGWHMNSWSLTIGEKTGAYQGK